ncbi:MAG: transposase [Syntrophorhabdales bacterium]
MYCITYAEVNNKILVDHPDVHTFMVGDWDKRETLADTGIPILDKRINRQVQNNNPLQRLIGYLDYKATLQGKKVEKFDERGTTRTCSCCGYVIEGGLPPSVRTFTCPECGFVTERDMNSTLNFLKLYQFALWQGLRELTVLSIARHAVSPTSGKNRRVLRRACVLNYTPRVILQDARGL